jgi:small-conductance mechanosensitive channel
VSCQLVSIKVLIKNIEILVLARSDVWGTELEHNFKLSSIHPEVKKMTQQKKLSAVQQAEILKKGIKAREQEIDKYAQENARAQELLDQMVDGVRKETVRKILVKAQEAEGKIPASAADLDAKLQSHRDLIATTNQLKSECAELLGVTGGGFFDPIGLPPEPEEEFVPIVPTVPFPDPGESFLIAQKDADLAKKAEEISQLKEENEKLHQEITTALNRATDAEISLANVQAKLQYTKSDIADLQNVDLLSIVRSSQYKNVPDVIKDKIANLAGKFKMILE